MASQGAQAPSTTAETDSQSTQVPQTPEVTRFFSEEIAESGDPHEPDSQTNAEATADEEASTQPLDDDEPQLPALDFPGELLDTEEVTLAKLRPFACMEVTKLNITQLCWESTGEYGQIRPLNDKLVDHYVAVLRTSQRLVPVSVLVRRFGTGVDTTPFRRTLM